MPVVAAATLAALLSIPQLCALPATGSQEQPSPTAPAHEQIDALWVERQAAARLAEEVEQLTREMGWADEDRAWFVREIVPVIARPTLGRTNSPAHKARMDRLLPELFIGPVPRSTGLGGNQPQPRMNPNRVVYMWLLDAYKRAGETWGRSRGLAGSGEGLPSPLLRPGLIRMDFYFHADWSKTNINRSDIPGYLSAELAAALREPGLSGEKARVVASSLQDLENDECSDLLVKAAETYAQRPDADPWFADFFNGVVLVQAAWKARGSDWAANTTQEQFDAFHALLRKAHARLVSAHSRRPDWPYAAATLVTVTMALAFEGESPMQWYLAAMKADPLDAAAGWNMAYAASPRWNCEGGTVLSRRLIAAASACTDYRSAVPATVIAGVLWGADAKSEALRPILREKSVYDNVKRVLLGYASANDPAVRPDVAKTMLMIMAYHADRPADAIAVLEEPGFAPVMPATLADVQPQEVRRWAMIELSSKRRTLVEAEAALSEGRQRDAEIMYRRAAAEQPAESPSGRYAAARAELIARVERARQGQRVDLLGVSDGLAPLTAWPVRAGWNVQIDERSERPSIAFTTKPDSETVLNDAVVEFPVPVGLKSGFANGYEVAFDTEFVSAGEPANAVVWLKLNHARSGDEAAFGPAVFLSPTRYGLSESYSDKPRQAPKGTLIPQPPPVASRRVRVLVQGWRAEVWCDGELVDWTAGKSGLKDDEHTPGEWLQLSGVGWKGASVRISNLTLCGLEQPLEKRAPRQRATR